MTANNFALTSDSFNGLVAQPRESNCDSILLNQNRHFGHNPVKLNELVSNDTPRASTFASSSWEGLEVVVKFIQGGVNLAPFNSYYTHSLQFKK